MSNSSTLLLTFGILLAVGPWCQAAPPPTAENPSESGKLRFRRVYFPEETTAWPKGNEKYLPLEAKEFNRLLQAAERTAPGPPAQTSIGLVGARYDARLKGQSLLQGSGTLDVSQSIASAMLMTLDPCNLAVARAQWVASNGAAAVLGITGDGKLQVLAERSGQMKFDWSLAGQRDPAGGVRFAVALPPSPLSRLRIELPAELVPTVDRGIVTDEGPMDLGFHRWRVELGGRSGCRLHLAKTGSEEGRPQAVLASQSTTYELSLRGLEVIVSLSIEAHREPLPKVVLDLDPALELVEVFTDGTSLSWNVAAKRGEKSRAAIIDIPPPLQEGPIKLRVRAIAPISMAGVWKLPRIAFPGACRSNAIRLSVPSPLCIKHLEARGCRQTSVAASSLPGENIDSSKSIASKKLPTSSDALKTPAGELLDFEAFAADAAIDISLGQRPTEVQAVSATTTVLGQGKMSSRVAADFHTAEGLVFSLVADVLPNWTIESIESQPTDGLDDWTLDGRSGAQKLSIRLARPLVPARPLRLVVLARRIYASPEYGGPAGRNLGIDDVVPLRFTVPTEGKRWVDLHASGSNELHFATGDRLQRANVKDLTAAELDLFAEPPGDLLFRDDAGASGLRLSLENRRPTYSAAIHVEAVAGDGLLAENYTFVCTPSKTAPIDRIVVHFAGRRETSLNWSVAGRDENRFSARRWTAQQQSSAGLTADEEVWDVAFRRPRSAATEIRASRKTKFREPTPVYLASLPDAARQEATLVVRSLGPQVVQIKTHRLTTLPTEAAPAGQVQTARASYQYEPRTEAVPQADSAIVLAPVNNPSATAWVWDCEVRSQFAADGAADHLVSYRIQNAGCRQIRLTLPVPLARRDVHGIWVDGKPAAALSSVGVSPAASGVGVSPAASGVGVSPAASGVGVSPAASGVGVSPAASGTDPNAGGTPTPPNAGGTPTLPDACQLAIDLPADLKFVTLVLRISARGEPLGTFSRLRPMLPDIGLPVFARRWRFELPPDYATCSYGRDPQTAMPSSFSLRRCLLGFLGRGEDESAFNPLRREDWQSALHGRSFNPEPGHPGYPLAGRGSSTVLRQQEPTTAVREKMAEDHLADRGLQPETAGWKQFPIDAADGAPTAVAIRRAAVDAAAWVLFLAIVGVGAWSFSGRSLALLSLAVMLGLAAMLVPEAISVIFSHGLLGVMFCLLLGLVRRRAAAADSAVSNRSAEMPSTLTGIVPFGAPLLAAILLCGDAAAEAGETAKAPTTHSVFIPVDAKQQPTQGKYFLPEPFFAELYRRAALQADKPQGWMIVSAVYRGALTEDMAQSGHVVDRLTAEFEVQVFNAAARVRIPLRREEVSLVPGQAQLDDRPVQPEWEPDGSALLLDIAEPGKYRLELTLRPTVSPGSRPSGFDLAIPRVPTARLEFSVATGGPAVEFPSAPGAVRWEEAQSCWTVDLGPSDRLAAAWQDSAPGAAAAIEVEQLLWLKIEPGCVLLDVRLKAKAANGQLRRLQVRADSALELLASSGTGEPHVRPRGGDALQTYEIQWPQPTGSARLPAATTLELHFLWSGATSQGTFRVPQIEVMDARPSRRWLAVSVHPALEYQVPGMRLQETAAVPEFLDSWGGSPSPPELALRLNGNAAEWNLITWARRAETSGDQNVIWSFNAQTAEVQLAAQLNTTSGSVFQYRLEAPSALRVSSIAVLAEGVNRVARWSQDPEGRITVFLASPLSGRHELQLRGQIPLPKKRKSALPQIRLEDVRIQYLLVSLFRRPDVLVEVSGVSGLDDVRTTEDDAGRGDLGRPVRSFYADSTAASPPLVTIKPNRLRVQAEQVTRITLADGEWQTACECHLQVSEGLLDAIELEIPATWKEKVKTSPAMAGRYSPVSEERMSLVLSPSAAVSGDATFVLSGPSSAAPQFAVANVALKRVQGVQRYVILPKSADGRSAAWSLHNLRRCDSKEPASDEAVKYEVLGEPWQAVLLPPQKRAAATRVARADIRYAWQADGRCLGAAFFDLENASPIDCPLELPQGFDLLQLTVDGLPIDALRRPAEDGDRAGTWTVPLASRASVSHVELLFFAESAVPQVPTGWGRRCSFLAPKLGDLPVERAVWTIAAPRTLQPTVADGEGVTPPDFSAHRAVSDLAARWQRFVDDGQVAVSYTSGGTAEAITLEYRPIAAQSWLPRLAGVVGFLFATGLIALLIRRGLLWNWFARWPYVFGVGLGLAWWLWLWPSAAGLVIVLAVLLRQFVPWRRFARAAG